MAPRSNTAQSDLEWLLEQIGAVARAWRIVLFVAVPIGIIGAALMFLAGPTQPTYISRATLPLNAYMRAILAQQDVTTSAELAPNSQIYTISASAHDPQQARAKLEEIIRGLAAAWDASDERRIEMARAETLRSALAELERFRTPLISDGLKASTPDLSERVKALVMVDKEMAEYRNRLIGVENARLKPDDIIDRPSLPDAAPQRGLFARIGIVIAGSLGLAIVLVGFFISKLPRLPRAG